MFFLRNIHYTVQAPPTFCKCHHHCHFGHSNEVMPVLVSINQSSQSETCIDGVALFCEPVGCLPGILGSAWVFLIRNCWPPEEGRILSFLRVYKKLRKMLPE